MLYSVIYSSDKQTYIYNLSLNQLIFFSYHQTLLNQANILLWVDHHTQWYAQARSIQERNQAGSDTAIQYCLMMNTYATKLKFN